MNDTNKKRIRRTFRPDVDSLEGRLVMSSGGAMHAAQVAQAEQAQPPKERRHLLHEQRVEHRQLLREQRVEHRRERQQMLRAERAARRHHRFVLAPQSNVSALAAADPNTPAQASLLRSSASQVNQAGVAVRNTRVPLTRISQPSLVGAARFGTLNASVLRGQTTPSTGVARTGGLNPNLANVVNANLLASGNSSLNPAVLNLTTPTAALTSNQPNIFGNGNATGTLFTNVPTAAGTTFVNNSGTNNPGVVFNNLASAPGTFTSTAGLNTGTGTLTTSTAGLNTGTGTLTTSNGLNTGVTTLTTGTTAVNTGTRPLFNNIATVPGTFSTTTGLGTTGMNGFLVNPSGSIVSSTPTNLATAATPLQTSIGAVTTGAMLGLNTNPLIVNPGGSTII